MSARAPETGGMAEIVTSERKNLVNSGAVSDADSQSRSLLAAPKGASSKGGGTLRKAGGPPAARLRGAGSEPGAGTDGAKAPGTRRAGHGTAVMGVLKTRAGQAVADEVDDTPELEGAGSAWEKATSAKRAASRIRGRARAKSVGAHGGAPGGAPAKGTAKAAKEASRTQAAKTAQAAARAQAAAQGASAAGSVAARQAASTAATGAAASGAAAPIAGVVAGVLAFVLCALVVSQAVSAIFGFWENESLKSMGSLTGVEQEIAAALKGYGFSDAATAGVLGNLKAESGMDPASDVNMDGQFNYAYERACGIFQYTSTSPGTGEYWSFKRWCSSNGKTWSTVAAQMEWTFSGQAGGTWSSRWSTALARSGYYSNCPGYTTGAYYTAGEYKEADDVERAAFSWMACYERPANGQYAHLDRRIEYAKEYLAKLSAPSYSGSSLIVEAAYSQLGVPYVWGGSTPGVGLDCSGLTQYCYAQAGISIDHYTESQYQQLDKVPLSQAQPGDILYRPGHVAIYIGDDKYIHEPRTGDVCKVASGIGYFTCALRHAG